MYNSQLYIVQEDAALAVVNFLESNHKLDDNKVLDEVQYDPVFWRNNELIKRTALENTLIKDFENKQLIGTYFQK